MSQSRPCVIVDFAHTPEAVRLVLRSVRSRGNGRLITVIGCGGDRDQGKRKEMGKIVSELSDFVWLTSDNPRSEDPAMIRKTLIKHSFNPIEVPNRRKAIKFGISYLKKIYSSKNPFNQL